MTAMSKLNPILASSAHSAEAYRQAIAQSSEAVVQWLQQPEMYQGKSVAELRERIRRQIIPFDEVRRRLELVGAPYEPEQIGVSRTRFREAFGKIPYMRSRYTVIDTAFRCGWMEEWLDRLFGKGGVWEVGSPAPGSGEPARSAAAPGPGA